MKITIDTKEDSHQDIRKVISLLSRMIEDSPPTSSSNIFESSSSTLDVGSSEPESAAEPAQNAFANMFGGSEPTTEPTSTIEDDTPVLGSTVLSDDDEEKEEEEEAQLMEY